LPRAFSFPPCLHEFLPMNVLYVFAALIALALTGYLCVALLKPEWFE
jgi:K+-transporting ATPase, KdpF subunit